MCVCVCGGRVCSVGIATTLGAGRSGNRIPVAAIFSAPDQAVSDVLPANPEIGTGSLSPGVKRSWRGADHPTPKTEVSNVSSPLLSSVPS